MSLARYANKRDANEAEIVKALESIGCIVYRLDKPVDLLVGYRTFNYLIEIKDGNKPPSRTKKTEAQKLFFENWKGQVRICRTAEEAIKLVTESYGKS